MYLVDNPLADKAAAAAAMEPPTVPATPALLLPSGSGQVSDMPLLGTCTLAACFLTCSGIARTSGPLHGHSRKEGKAIKRPAYCLNTTQVASPAAALGLFDLEEFSFGAPPASFHDSTPGLLMEQSLGAPSTLQDVEVLPASCT